MKKRILFIVAALLLGAWVVAVEEPVGFSITDNTEFLITNPSGSTILGYGVVLSGNLEIRVSYQISEFLLIAVAGGRAPQVKTFFGYVDASGQLVIVNEHGTHVFVADWLRASSIHYYVTPVPREHLSQDGHARGIFERVRAVPPADPVETLPPGHHPHPPGQGFTPPPGHGATPPGQGQPPAESSSPPNPPPGQGGIPPGQGGTPPGQGQQPPAEPAPPDPPGSPNPPGHGGNPPPGHGGTPPGQGDNPNPPGQGNPTPPGQGGNQPPGQGGNPPGQGNPNPPGQGGNPNPPGQGNPPGRGNR